MPANPRGLSKQVFPSLSQASGVEATAALPGAAAPRSAGRWRVARPQSPLRPHASRLGRLLARRPAPFVCAERAFASRLRCLPLLFCLLLPPARIFSPPPAAGPRRPADLLDHSPRTPLPQRCLLSTKLRRSLQPPSGAETKSGGAFSRCLSAPLPGAGHRGRSCCLAWSFRNVLGHGRGRGWQGGSGACRHCRRRRRPPGRRRRCLRGRCTRSLGWPDEGPSQRGRTARRRRAPRGHRGRPPGGCASDPQAQQHHQGKPSRSGPERGCGRRRGRGPPGGRMFIAPGRHRRQGIVFSHLLHCQTFLLSPEVPRLLALRSRSDFPSDSQGKVPLCALRFCGLMDAFPHFLGKLL